MAKPNPFAKFQKAKAEDAKAKGGDKKKPEKKGKC